MKIKAGELIAVNSQKYPDRPLIGRATEVDSKKVKLEWMIGTYSGTWKEWRGREDGEQVVYTDVIPRTDVVYHPINLTRSMKLSSQTVSELKKIYKKY